MKSPRVTAIILNWNGLKDTIECLESLRAAPYDGLEIMVLDNGSTADEGSILSADFGSWARVIRQENNLGFAGGNNFCMRYALEHSPPDYFLLLNNDTVVDPGFLTYLVEAAENEPASGIAGPKVYYHSLPDHIQTAGVSVNLLTGSISAMGRGEIDTGQHNRKRAVPSIMGCCMLIRRQLVDSVGLLDEDYFLYHEETDYCLRASRAGFGVLYVPAAIIWHKTPVRRKIWQRMSGNRGGGHAQTYYLTRNLFLLERKNGSRVQYWVYVTLFFVFRLWFLLGVCLLYYREWKRVTGLFQGVGDGLKGKTGPRTWAPPLV